MSRRQSVTTALLVFGATLRLTRFVTRDWLGEWLIVGPAKKWANTYELAAVEVESKKPAAQQDYQHGFITRQAKLVKGLDCPYCVGFWIGLLVIVGTITVGKLPVLGTLWRIVLGALSLNYAVGAVSSRIDE